MVRAARPDVPSSRPYTGWNGPAIGITGGLAQWIIEAKRTSNGVLWNNGAFGIRDQRGHRGVPSIHGTGRAVDLSFRRFQGRGVRGGRPLAVAWLDRVVEANAELGLEAVLDYWPEPFGRGWFCDRQRWHDYRTPVIHGAPKGDWFHIEISPAFAANPRRVREGFAAVFPEVPRVPKGSTT